MAHQKVVAAKRVVHLKRPSTNLSQQGAPPIAASFHTTTSQTSSHQNFPKAQDGPKVAQDRPKIAQDMPRAGPRTVQGRPKTGSSWLKTRLRQLKASPT